MLKLCAVNAIGPPLAPLVIDVVHDLVCPWCYVGVRRLRRALAGWPAGSFAIVWRPFLLNPDMPRHGVPRLEYVRHRFGGSGRAARLEAAVAEAGRREGLLFRFDRMRRMPSSLAAHRVVRWAARFGRADAVVEAMFAAHFCEGRDIGDAATLALIAAGCGLRAAAAQAYLESGAEADAVHTENLRAHRMGIGGVPCFVVNGTHAIAGAQDAEVIRRLLELAAGGAGASLDAGAGQVTLDPA